MKFSINKSMLAGNVGADPETRFMPNGTQVTTVRLATSKSYKDKDGEWHETTEWHTVKFFAKQAEYAAQRIRKGTAIYVEGEIRTRKWTDKNGVERYTTAIVSDELKVIDKGKRSGEGAANSAAPSETNGGADNNDGDWKFDGEDDVAF